MVYIEASNWKILLEPRLVVLVFDSLALTDAAAVSWQTPADCKIYNVIYNRSVFPPPRRDKRRPIVIYNVIYNRSG